MHEGGRGVTHTGASPHARLRGVPVEAVTVDDGLWRVRMDANRARALPALLTRLEEHGVVDNFRRLAHPGCAERRGYWFTDSDLYKWMEAAAWSLAGHDDPPLWAALERTVDAVVAAQQDDGYLDTAFVGDERLTHLDWSHELYCAGHLIQAAIALHRAKGDGRLLDAAVRFADLIDRELGPGGRAETDVHPGVEMALVELARETGENRYVDLAAALAGRVDLAGGERVELWGHAVRAVYLACALADLGAETGDDAVLAAARTLWASMARERSYVTGSVGGRWLGESVGRAYELPAEGSYAETCAGIGVAMWAWRMLTLTGEAQFADRLELVLHNAFLASVSHAGDEWFYANPLAFAARGEHDPWATDRFAEELAGPFPLRRRPWRDVTCCPPNAARTLASLPGYLYGLDRTGSDLWVHLYVASTVRHAGWVLTQRAELPWSGRVELTIGDAPPGEHALMVRVPAWCRDATITCEGARIPASGPATYASIRREWQPGDTVTLDLVVAPELVVCNPRVAEYRGSVALRRGPLVYCLEGVDNEGIDVLAAAVRGDDFEEEWQPDVLGGVVTVRARGSAPARDWGSLYRAQRDPARDERAVTLTAIPYFAWANRGTWPMTVWMRRADR